MFCLRYISGAPLSCLFELGLQVFSANAPPPPLAFQMNSNLRGSEVTVLAGFGWVLWVGLRNGVGLTAPSTGLTRVPVYWGLHRVKKHTHIHFGTYDHITAMYLNEVSCFKMTLAISGIRNL